MHRLAVLPALLLPVLLAHAADSVLVFNEIQYHPPAGQTEWIELRSLQAVDVPIGGWRIEGGVDFTFPANTIMPGGGYLVIAASPTQIPGALGPWTGQLANNGETLRLLNLNGRVMDEVTYNDAGDWPPGADGSGATLARRATSAAAGATAWAASAQIGGTPGAQNFPASETQNRTHISKGASWKYRDAVAAPPGDWNDAAFDDTAWPSGNAPLGAQPPVTTLTVTTNLVERFRASDITGLANGAVVTTWTDTANGAAYGDSVAQNATGANSPTWQSNVVNGKAVVRFPNSGTGEMRTSLAPGIGSSSGWAIFMVVKANTTPTSGQTGDGAGDYLLDRRDATNQLASIKAVGGKFGLQKRNDAGLGLGGPNSTTSISTSAFQIVAIRRNRTLNQFELWVNGVMEGTAADDGSALTPNSILIAHHQIAGTTQGFKGDVAEVLVYKVELSELDFQKVGVYLETEYGLNTAFQVVATTLATAAPTCYFRKSFNFPGEPLRTALRLNHTIADGAVFYLNGSEILRTNMPGGTVDHNTSASSVIASPAASGFVSVPADALVNGNNVLAVSLHKGPGGTSSYFDAALESTEQPENPNTAGQLRFNEITAASDPAFYIELQNISGMALDTSGWSLAASSGQSVALPAQIIPSGGLITIDTATLGFTPNDGTRLYLLAPGGTGLRDTREVTDRLRGLTSDGRWGYPDSPTPGTTNVVTVSGDIVINEIFYHAPGTSLEQWIELYNRSAAPVDVSGWKFTDGIGWEFPAGTPPIPAGGFAVVAWDPAAFQALHGFTPFGPFTGSLSGKRETLTLRDANDNIVNQLTYTDGGRWSQWADGGGSSLELRDARSDNSKGEAWDASDESSHSSWTTPTLPYQAQATNPNASDPTNYNEFDFGLLDSGEFLIDDISVKDVSGGNVELIQNGNFNSGTAAFWRIIGTHAGSIVDDPLAPGNKVLKVSATSGTEHMNNHAETTLKNGASYHLIDPTHTYSINFRAKWLRGSNRLHTRLWHNRLARQTLLNMPATGGTPGAPNSRAVANIGPTFDALAHSPVVPAASQAATVTIKVADPDGVSNVQLYYSVNGGAFTNVAMTTTGGGVYTGSVPGQNANALVQFYVRAADSLGAISDFPAAGPASRAMIPWQDGRAQLTLASGAKPHNIRVVLPTADATELYKPENLMSDRALPCTVILDEAIPFYRAGVRLKSSEHGRISEARCGYTLEFPSDDLFLGLHDTISLDRSGGVVTGQKEILLKRLENSAGGIYASEDDICRVISAVGTLPAAQYFTGAGITGAAIMSKTRLDKEFLDAQWPNGGDGSQFKYERVYVLTQTINSSRVINNPTFGAGGTVLTSIGEDPKVPQDTTAPPGVNVTSLGANKENYRWYWLLQNNREADDYSGIINVTNAMGTSNQTLMNQYIDVSTWLRGAIPSTLYGVIDNYLGAGGGQHNVLIQFPPGQKAVLIPWDLDFLDQTSPGVTTASLTAGGDVAKFLTNGAWKRLFWGHMLDILNRTFNTSFMTTWATHYSRFGTDDMTAQVSAYLTPRASFAMSQITANIPMVTFARTSASPVTVNTPFATVSGDGWVNVAQIRLLGSAEALAVTWIDDNSWTLQIPVGAGTHTYTLVAYSPTGAQVGSTSVTVTGTGGVFPADAGSLVVSELNYNPTGSSDATEFIELLNITGATLDLSGCHFDEEAGEGIAYTFPSGVQIPPGGRLLVVRDRAAFMAMYPGAGPLAPNQFIGALDNGGETIVLYAASGLEIFRFTYDDSLASTDGGGKSLVRVLSSTNPNPFTYAWRESIQAGGNPGTSDALAFTGSPTADGDGDGAIALLEYGCGTSDNDPGSLPPPPQFIFNGDGTVSVVYQVVPNADDVVTTIESSTDLSSWVPVNGPVIAGQKRYFHLRVIER